MFGVNVKCECAVAKQLIFDTNSPLLRIYATSKILFGTVTEGIFSSDDDEMTCN